MNSGYSNTPLAKKLDLKQNFICYIINPPKTYHNWINSLELNLTFCDSPLENSIDFIHVFCKSKERFQFLITSIIPLLKLNGILWVSWPKGHSKLITDLKREPIRAFVLANGLVDIKVAAIDDDWSGLKFVYRLKDRK